MKKIVSVLGFIFVFSCTTTPDLPKKSKTSVLTKNSLLFIEKMNLPGVLPETEELPKKYYIRSNTKSGFVLNIIPDKLDLSEKMPPVGNQQHQGSCTAWATAYAAKTYFEGLEETWDLNLSKNQFSPAWIYNQINGGQDNGSKISDALNLMVDKGVDTLANVPYNPDDYLTKPGDDSFKAARRYRLASWFKLPNDPIDIKGFLSEGKAVVFKLRVCNDFNLDPDTNQIYDDPANPCGSYHAMVFVGYDDSKKAFKYMNSWGADYGVYKDENDTSKGKGYGWLSYDFVVSPSPIGFEAYVLFDKANPPLVNDETAPVVNITSHNDGDAVYRDKQIEITAIVTDENDITDIECWIRDKRYAYGSRLAVDKTEPYSCTWDTAIYNDGSDGDYEIIVYAYDIAGNKGVAIKNITLMKDPFAPQVNIISPSEGQIIQDILNISANVVDDGAIIRVDFFVNGTLVVSDKTSPYEALNLTEIHIGSVNIDVIAYDNEGNFSKKTSVTAQFTKNTPTLILNINEQEDGYIIYAQASDNNKIGKVDFFVDNNLKKTFEEAYKNCWGPCVYHWKTDNESAGDHHIKVKVYDGHLNENNEFVSDGNMVEKEVVLNVNHTPNQAPIINITNISAGQTVSGIINVDVQVSDPDNKGIKKTLLYINGMLKKETYNAYLQYEWKTHWYNNGNYELKVVAFDNYDEAAPNAKSEKIISVNVNNFICKEYTDTNFNHIQAGRAESYQYNVYAKTIGAGDELGQVGNAILSPESTLAETSAGFFIKGNCSNEDTEKPVVQILAPSNNATVENQINITANITDNIAINCAKVYINKAEICSLSTSPYECLLNTKDYTNGSYTIKVVASDKVGNEETKAIQVNIDNDVAAPEISLTNLTPNKKLNGVVTFTSNVTDNVAVTKVIYTFNESVACEVLTIPFSCDFDTTLVSNGAYSVQAEAYDKAGNKGESVIINVQVENNESSCQDFTATNLHHIITGKAVEGGLMNMYAVAVGSGDSLGLIGSEYYSTITTIKETSPGYFEAGSCN